MTVILMRRGHNLLLPALRGVAAAETAQIPNRLPVQSSVAIIQFAGSANT